MFDWGDIVTSVFESVVAVFEFSVDEPSLLVVDVVVDSELLVSVFVLSLLVLVELSDDEPPVLDSEVVEESELLDSVEVLPDELSVLEELDSFVVLSELEDEEEDESFEELSVEELDSFVVLLELSSVVPDEFSVVDSLELLDSLSELDDAHLSAGIVSEKLPLLLCLDVPEVEVCAAQPIV